MSGWSADDVKKYNKSSSWSADDIKNYKPPKVEKKKITTAPIDKPKKSLMDNVGDFLNKNLSRTVTPTHTNVKASQSVTFDKKKLDKASGTAGAFVSNLVDSATLGLATKGLNKFEKGLGDKALVDASKGHKIASTVGNLAGYTVPFGVASKVAKPLTKGITNKLFKTVAVGATEGAIVGGTEGGIKGKNVAKSAAEMAVLGVGGNLAIAGVGKLVSKVLKPRVFENKVTSKTFKPTKDIKTISQSKAFFKPTETGYEPMKLNRKLTSSNPVEQPNIVNHTNTKASTQNASDGFMRASMSSADGEVASGLEFSRLKNAKLKPGTKFSSNLKEGQKVSKLYSNSYANANPEVISDNVKKAMDETKFIYQNQTNAEQLAMAEKRLNQNGLESEMNRIRNMTEVSGDDTMSHYLITKHLTDEANKTGDTSKLLNWLEESRPKYTQAGQGIQALKQFKKMTPEGAVNLAVNEVGKVKDVIKKTNPAKFDKAMEKINKLPKDENFESAKNKILNDHGIPTLSSEETKFIIDSMNKAKTLADGREKDVLLGQVRQLIIDKSPSTWVDKVRAVRNISLLGNLKTFNRNIIGNGLLGTLDNASNVVGATVLKPLDKYMAGLKNAKGELLTGMETTAMPSIKIQAKGMKKGLNNAISDSLGGLTNADLKGLPLNKKISKINQGALNPIDTGNIDFNKFEQGRKLAFKNKPMRIAENLVNTSLRAGDRPFSQAYYDDIINQFKKANKTDIVTDEMKATAENVARQRTYQDDNAISNAMMGLKKIPKSNTGKVIIDSLIPYAKTPANIMKRGIEYTPSGMVEGAYRLSKGIKKGTLDLQEQRKIMDVISRGLVGTGVIGGGIVAGKAGVANGAASTDADVRNLEANARKLPNSIKIGDKYHDYSWAQPASTPFGAGVQMTKGKNGLASSIGEGASNALNYYTDMPMLQSIQRLMGSGNNDKPFGDRALEAGLNIPTQFVPTLLKQVAQKMDNTTRNTTDGSKVKTTANIIQSRIPIASKSLQPKIDTLGREIKNYYGNNTIINNFMNPGKSATYNPTPAEKLVLAIYDKTGMKTQFPRVAPKKDANGKALNVGYQTELQKEMGTQTLEMLNSMAKNIDVANMSEKQLENLANRIESRLTKIQDRAKHKILPKELRVKSKD